MHRISQRQLKTINLLKTDLAKAEKDYLASKKTYDELKSAYDQLYKAAYG